MKLSPDSDINAFYLSLTPLERTYWDSLAALFNRVNPQKPEKGIQALLLRARKTAENTPCSLEIALVDMLQAATERTERRIALLSQCALKPSLD